MNKKQKIFYIFGFINLISGLINNYYSKPIFNNVIVSIIFLVFHLFIISVIILVFVLIFLNDYEII